uniref:FLYWCH-type domain-containing protein n=1 Tax=Panagrolaimus sp. JU765 TaxID=591449 RepID=A0AC34QVF3_9BILA
MEAVQGVEFKSERGGIKIAAGGFVYNIDRRSKTDPNIMTLRCEKNCLRPAECKGRSKSVNLMVTITVQHQHSPNHEYAQAQILKRELYNKAESSANNRQTKDAFLEKISDGILQYLPSEEAIFRSMQRQRTKNNEPIPTPKD